ncbi:uncharacterized protein YMR317W-like isoform X1 [Actinia tenebrosa]|uniref:Uncharacterized protein YMR317W-like isoform X1 n=1 Tax=Actinia tenebrosa TaxID=6105 RepID=A0A6P8I9I5_ACTTE|nr:uncharacterized protein YMR317W-like isoform X1 [Actinia tenebrosa]
MPTVPSSTPAPLPTKQEKFAMPTVPSSTPAPLPTKQVNAIETPTSSIATTPEKSDVKQNENEKLSMPTTPSLPSSTPAPLPTEQVSPKTESNLASPTSPPALVPTKSDAEKPDTSSKSKPSVKASPTKSVAPKAAPTSSSLISAKKEPTMPAKELPVESVGSRRSNITAVRSDPLEEFDDKSKKAKAIPKNEVKKEYKQSKEDEIVQDVLEKANIFNQSDSDDTVLQVAKLFNNQSVAEDSVHEVSDSPKNHESSKTKQDVLPKQKPVSYTRTQPASSILGKVCKARVDLVFLLDGSQASDKMHFTKSLTFVKDLIKSFSVSKDDAHVSVAVCSEKPHILFDLNAFTDHRSIERAMSSVAYPSGKMFAGGCLKTIKSAIFENSGRHGVPKILYFMSSGGSNDHVALPSRALRDLSVQVFSLGLGTKYNARELKEIATAPYSDHVLATRYEILGLLRPFVTAQLCRGSGGKLVLKPHKKPLVKPNEKHLEHTERQVKSKVPIKNESSLRKSMLFKLKEKEEKKKAALKADIRKKLHILLSKLGRKFHNENAIYRSIVYNINGHRDAGCKDYHVLCKTWGKQGYCKTSSKHGIDAYSVQRVCPKTCVVCYP